MWTGLLVVMQIDHKMLVLQEAKVAVVAQKSSAKLQGFQMRLVVIRVETTTA